MPNISSEHPIAYFCAEYGLHHQLPFYAGGLGVLAGDTIKAAADQNLPMIAIGLMYRGDNAIQIINQDGMQEEKDMKFDPVEAGLEHVYLDDQPLFIKVHLTEIDIWVRIWKKTLSENAILYLLDTETDQNQMSERSITHELYAGTAESILKQQFILGIGGVKLLRNLGIHPAVYHINEGRAAFLHWQLIRTFMEMYCLDFFEAGRRAKEITVYTNHTLVAAGNYSIDTNLLKRYAKYYADKMKVSYEQLIDAGIEKKDDRFYMTRFSLNISKKASGVSQLHTELSKKQWPNYNWVNITNGVHMPSWQDVAIKNCNLENDDLWQIHLTNKKKLADYCQAKTGFSYDPNRCVIAWARRLAGYKRLEELLIDIERLRSILRHKEKPVQLLVAGKAHVYDEAGKAMLQRVIKHMARELADFSLFIPDYNLEVAKMLVQGSDLWLNTPRFGEEACGTSGMKAISNGVLQCTVADGWAHEVDWQGIGWTLDSDNLNENIYQKLETEIIPLYFNRNEQGIPKKWLEMMKKSIKLSQRFDAARMLNEYQSQLYSG